MSGTRGANAASQRAAKMRLARARGEMLVCFQNMSYTCIVLFNPHKRRTPPCWKHESAPKPAIRSELMPACNYCTYLTTDNAIQIPPILRIERDIARFGGAL